MIGETIPSGTVTLNRSLNQQEETLRLVKWDYRFLDLADLVGSWSKDPSTKVGAVIVRPDLTIASTGFNGFPKNCSDASEIYEDRDLKLARVIHAEVNALLLAGEDVEGYTLYSSFIGIGPSCDRCSAHIIQAGIDRVVHRIDPDPDESAERWKDSIQRGLDMFEEAGVQVTGLPMPDLKVNFGAGI